MIDVPPMVALDPETESPACTCPNATVVHYLGLHAEGCPAVALEAPRPAWTPSGWQQ